MWEGKTSVGWKVRTISITLLSQTITLPKQQPFGLLQAVLSSLTFILWNKGKKKYGWAQPSSACSQSTRPPGRTLQGWLFLGCIFIVLFLSQICRLCLGKPRGIRSLLREPFCIPVHCLQWISNAFWEAKSLAREPQLISRPQSTSRPLQGIRFYSWTWCKRRKRRRGFCV